MLKDWHPEARRVFSRLAALALLLPATGLLLFALYQVGILLSTTTFDPKSKLGFFAGLLGSAAGAVFAIFGSVFLENHRRRHTSRQVITLVVGAFGSLRECLRPMDASILFQQNQEPEKRYDPFVRGGIVNTIKFEGQSVLALLDAVSLTSALNDFFLFSAIYRVRTSLSQGVAFPELQSLPSEFVVGEEEAWNSFFHLGAWTCELEQELEAAIKQLERIRV